MPSGTVIGVTITIQVVSAMFLTLLQLFMECFLDICMDDGQFAQSLHHNVPYPMNGAYWCPHFFVVPSLVKQPRSCVLRLLCIPPTSCIAHSAFQSSPLFWAFGDTGVSLFHFAFNFSPFVLRMLWGLVSSSALLLAFSQGRAVGP